MWLGSWMWRVGRGLRWVEEGVGMERGKGGRGARGGGMRVVVMSRSGKRWCKVALLGNCSE